MKRLAAILIVISIIVIAIITLAVTTFISPAMAASANGRPQGRMQACTQQWMDLKAAGQTGPAGYRTFLRQCLSGQTAGLAVPLAQPSVRRVKVSGKSPDKSPGTPPGKAPNRMKVCGAKWQQMKATGTTDGMTYRQFSSQCLRTH